MKSRLVIVSTLAMAFVLGGCASQQGNPATASALTARGVGPSTIVKVENGQRLNYQDLLDMVQRGVPTNLITGYLESTGAVYDFGPIQLRALKQEGASDQLINYLQETQGFYGRAGGQGGSSSSGSLTGSARRAYYNTPLYQDQQPFAYNEPMIDGFYDSGYEESLYSPFSYN